MENLLCVISIVAWCPNTDPPLCAEVLECEVACTFVSRSTPAITPAMPPSSIWWVPDGSVGMSGTNSTRLTVRPAPACTLNLFGRTVEAFAAPVVPWMIQVSPSGTGTLV